jgi:hypothetical protein
MVGGRLERAVDEVADLVASRPAWMAGNPAEFNEEQLRLYKEYAAKEQAAIEERLKRKSVMVGGAGAQIRVYNMLAVFGPRLWCFALRV